MPQRLEALGLGDLWTVKFAGGADALWAELKAAEKEGRGTIISTGHQTLQMVQDLHLLSFLLTMLVADQLMVVMGNVVHLMVI